MKIEVLYEFASLAKTLNFSATARQRYVSQSTLSKHIYSLEKELGCQLFVRDSQHVALTSIGKALSQDIEDVIEAYEKCMSTVNRMKHSVRTRLSIGYLYGASHALITETFSVFNERFPDVEVRFTREQGESLRQNLQNGTFDLVFDMDTGGYNSAQYSKVPVYKDCYGALIADSHPLSASNGVSLEDLAEETLLLPSHKRFEDSTAFLQDILSDELGSKAKIEAIISDPTELPLHIRRGAGVGLVVGHAVGTIDTTGLVYLPITRPQLCFDVCAIWRKTRESHALIEYAKVIRQTALNS